MIWGIPATHYWLYILHPMLMWLVFTLTLYALYLGIQVRRSRTLPADMSVSLQQQRFPQRHYQLGSLLLALIMLGLLGAIAVEYMNNGRLYLAPHLLSGLGLAILMASSAALAPLMQQGKTWARSMHLGLAIAIVSLLTWQVVTGGHIILEIITGTA